MSLENHLKLYKNKHVRFKIKSIFNQSPMSIVSSLNKANRASPTIHGTIFPATSLLQDLQLISKVYHHLNAISVASHTHMLEDVQIALHMVKLAETVVNSIISLNNAYPDDNHCQAIFHLPRYKQSLYSNLNVSKKDPPTPTATMKMKISTLVMSKLPRTYL